MPYTTAASQFLYGRSVVEAALRARRRKMYKLYVSEEASRDRQSTITALARNQGVETAILDGHDRRLLDKMSQGRPHNGYILEASPLPQPPLAGIGEFSSTPSRTGFNVMLGHQSREEELVNGKDDFVPVWSGKYNPLLLVLEQVLDPGNLGAILRTASFLGVSAVAISQGASAPLTNVALKASAGAAESLALFSVESTAALLDSAKDAGWKVFATAPATSRTKHSRHMDLMDVEKSDPLAKSPCILLVGNEGDGLPRMLKAKADFEISIPNHSESDVVDSLNVSVATGLVCSSFFRGRSQVKDELDLFGM